MSALTDLFDEVGVGCTIERLGKHLYVASEDVWAMATSGRTPEDALQKLVDKVRPARQGLREAHLPPRKGTHRQ